MAKSDAGGTPNEEASREDGIQLAPVEENSEPQTLSMTDTGRLNIRSQARVLAILVALYVSC
jgi:hypothetical protein